MAEHIDHAAMAHMLGGMDHGGMDHGGGHGGMPMPMPMHCKMDMTMTWDWPLQRCVVFSSWHLGSSSDIYVALIVLVLLAAAFEYLRWRIRAIDTLLALDLARSSTSAHRHARKASLAPASDGRARGLHGHSESVSSGLLPSSSIADRRTPSRTTFGDAHACGPSASSSSSHTALDMDGAAAQEDGYRDQHAHAHEDGSEALLGDDARAKAARQNRLLGASGNGPSSVVSAFFCSPKTLRVSTRVQLIRAGLYGMNVAAGAFLMLVLMTYNVWREIAATIAGAMLGHFFFSRELGLIPPSSRQDGSVGLITVPGIDVDKGLSCH